MSLHFIEDFVYSVIVFFGDNIWLGLVVAPVLGLLMSFTPCCLAQAGLAVRCVEGHSRRDRLNNSLLFALGSVLCFVVVAVLVYVLGEAMSSLEWLFHVVLGGLLMISVIWALFFDKRHKRHAHNLSVQEVDLVIDDIQDRDNTSGSTGFVEIEQDLHCDCNLHIHTHGVQSKSRIFAHGIAGAVFAFPCSIPVIFAIIAFANLADSWLAGALMIALYIVGHNILPVVAGVSARSMFKKRGVGSKVFGIAKVAFLVLFAIFAVVMIVEGVGEYK